MVFSVYNQIVFACAKCSDFAPSRYPLKRMFFRFSVKDLIAYLHENPEICQQLMSKSADKRYSPSIFILPTQKGYIVGKSQYKKPSEYLQVQLFGLLEEAAADYVLWNWKLPRLRSQRDNHRIKATLDNKDSLGSIILLDEDGEQFDRVPINTIQYIHTDKTD